MKKTPAPAHQRPDREEVHVDAARRMVGRMSVLVQRVLQHQVIEIRLVRRQEDHRMALAQVVDLLEPAAIVVQALLVALRVKHMDELRESSIRNGLWVAAISRR